MAHADSASLKPSTGNAAHPDRRTAERTYTVFRVARLILPDGDQLGIVRNISERGMMMELHAQIDLGNSVTLDLGEGLRLQGEVRWRSGTAAGFNFVEPIDVARALGRKVGDHRNADGKVPRLPRIRTDSPAEIAFGTCTAGARLVNISIGGACVETFAPVAPHEKIALTIPSLPTKLGTVRWRRGNLAGVVFDRPMSVQALMEWLANHPRSDQAASPDTPLFDDVGGACGESAIRHAHGAPVLSKRELQVLQKVACGLSNEEIGVDFGLSRRTVEIHRARILAKLGAPNTAAAIMIACKTGLV